jgi:hypothetical protein
VTVSSGLAMMKMVQMAGYTTVLFFNKKRPFLQQKIEFIHIYSIGVNPLVWTVFIVHALAELCVYSFLYNLVLSRYKVEPYDDPHSSISIFHLILIPANSLYFATNSCFRPAFVLRIYIVSFIDNCFSM